MQPPLGPDLCTRIPADLICTFLNLWGQNPSDTTYLDFLRDVTVLGGLPIPRTQTLVMTALVEQQTDALQVTATVLHCDSRHYMPMVQ